MALSFRNGAHFRRTLRSWSGRLVALMLVGKSVRRRLVLRNISSILICRVNSRMGNTLFLIPLIRTLHELLPRASIDLFLGNRDVAELLDRLPSVRRTMVLPQKPVSLRACIEAIRRLRSWKYDLAIDPVHESTSGRLALTVSRSRYKLGYLNSSQWAPLTHAIPDRCCTGRVHEAELGLHLLCHALSRPVETHGVRLTLPLSAAERARGRELMSAILGARRSEGLPPLFGFFAHARGEKALGPLWWNGFWKVFLEHEPTVLPCEFLPDSDTPPVLATGVSTYQPRLADLLSCIEATKAFVSADTGPMHLASATSVPTIALFRRSDPVLYGPLKPTDLAIDVNNSTVRETAEACVRHWRQYSERTVMRPVSASAFAAGP